MQILRRLGSGLVAAFVVSTMLAAPAQAQAKEVETVTQTESYAATALARALELSLLNLNLTVGASGIEINSSPSAKATGAGVALLPNTVSEAKVAAAGQTSAPPKSCGVNLPLSIINVELACGETAVATNADGPQALGRGTVAAIDIGGGQLLQLLQPVIDLLRPVLGTVLAVVQPVLGGLQLPLVGQLVGLDPTKDPVSDLVERLTKATALVSIKLGNSTAAGTTTAGKVTSEGNAQGAQIDVLPGLTLGGSPLLSIVVGSAKATATFDRAGGKADATFDGAIATVKVGLPILGGDLLEIPIKLGQPIRLLEGTPLESEISLGAGSTKRESDGAISAVADGVKIHLLKGISGGIKLELAHAEAAVGGRAKIVSKQQVIQPVPQLAKTGGAPWLPLAGATLIMAAFMTRRLTLARPSGNSQPVEA
ncbi:MAG: hypothetical protein ACT4OS_03750 [Acidimicrobiales bacterium]